ncbi:MAG TPA: hypothetical protein VF553_19245 [Pyrinomonadaceae bacterium]|jgi:hypothetical protein
MPLTWEQLAAREPELGRLREEIEEVDAIDSTFCANRMWYESLKPRMMKLFGDMAQSEGPVIISSEAYDLSKQAALPNNSYGPTTILRMKESSWTISCGYFESLGKADARIEPFLPRERRQLRLPGCPGVHCCVEKTRLRAQSDSLALLPYAPHLFFAIYLLELRLPLEPTPGGSTLLLPLLEAPPPIP